MEKKSKFHITKNTAFWAILAAALCFIVYVIILIAIEVMAQTNDPAPYGFFVARDVFLVVFTILLTTLLTGWLVEVRTKNEIYANAILQDVFANPVFYKEFSDSSKKLMLEELERELLFANNSEIQKMYGSIQKKLSDVKADGYYYEACNYHVSCSIENDIITKRINRTIRLRSYAGQYTLRELPVLNWTGLEEIGDHFELKEITYNGIPTKAYKIENIPSPTDTDSFCGYSISHLCKLTRDVELFSDKNTSISVSYITKVPLTDNLYTCRTGVPCKNFSVHIYLEGDSDYKLNAVAFGFQDSASQSPACVNDREVRIEFEDWIFSKDGVTVAFAPKQPVKETSGAEK